MTDIPQWRRRIPPSRSRTTLVEITEPDQDTRPASSLAAASATRPPTPKRGLRPKLSLYLSQSGPFGNASKPEPKPVFSKELPQEQEFPSWAIEDPFPHPTAEQLTDVIMCRLMSQPYDTLDVSFHGSLLQIFEAYRDLSEQRNRLEKTLEVEIQGRLEERSTHQQAQYSWDEERQTYKAEVKRLELIIAKGKGGVGDVALARQDSLIRRRQQWTTPDDEHDGKETVFEFLEKTKRFEDPSWSGQRATMKTRPASPSARMAKLSKKLTKKISKTSILAELPFGSPPPHLPSMSLLQASYLEDQAALAEKKRAEDRSQVTFDARASFSDDTTSTFSCTGDLLPDEASEKGLQLSSPPLLSTLDEDTEDIRRMAATISDRRGISVESVMPRLLDLFRTQTLAADVQTPQTNNHQLQRVAPVPAANPASGTPVRKPSHIMGFINKLRPQLSLETSLETRRFSFEFGDDCRPLGATCQSTTSRESLLRQSHSLSSLPNATSRKAAIRPPIDLSPVESSPTTSAQTTDSRRTSKIPSPVYNAALARPRQDREDSASSLLTVVKNSDHSGHRSNSGASSVYSSRSLHHDNNETAQSASRAAQSHPVEWAVNRLEPDRMHGFSSTQAAGTGSIRQLSEYTNMARAGTSQGGSITSTRDNGRADTSNTPSRKIVSPMRAAPDGTSRPIHDIGVHPLRVALENVPPSEDPRSREDYGDDAVGGH